MKRLAVVALGGNALLLGSQAGTIQEQERNSYNTCKHLLELLKNYELVITHGNGPQVGNILLRNDAGYRLYSIPKMPLDICVADSQGGIGYMIERQMLNLLREHHINKKVITIVTQVLVDKNDPAFRDPSKPIGQFYTKRTANKLAAENNWKYEEDARKRGWRRVVPSPCPVDILNREIIRSQAELGNIVIAAGGGGIPVYYDDDGNLQGVDGVVDKDLTASQLAVKINADVFISLTDVPKVCINYGEPGQRELNRLKVTTAKKYMKQGQFPNGSMGPKITAAIKFVEATGRETVIAKASHLSEKKCGTRIVV
jgi:carbamate kinase